jgi:hypothetical protein
MHYQRDEEHNQEYKKENLGNARRGEGDASKSQKSRDECHNQENQCVIKHLFPPRALEQQRLRMLV